MSQAGGDVGVASVRVATKNGRIRLIAEDRPDIEVEGRALVGDDVGRVTIETTNESVVVRVPLGCDVVAGTVNGRIIAEGRLGAVAAVSETGRVSIESARSADVRTTSGRIEAGVIDGEFRAHTSSGRVTAEVTGAADVSTVSGRIDLANVAGPVRAHCTSGRIAIRLTGAHDVVAETVSGRVSVSIPAGVRVHRAADLTGERPADRDCTVVARSVSGRVTVT
jgi:hypothetical protein